jgi:anaerobic carbon-monoxide dehydrogenase iron sulfur subunit
VAKMIVVNEQRCLACKTCVVECAMAHSDSETLAEALQSGSRPQPRVHVEAAGAGGLPLQCRHCQDAPCITICPTHALDRANQDSPVLVDAERCIGCKFCMIVCPFGVIDLSLDGKAAVKCDLCITRTQAGQEPACVAGCPTGALKFEELGDYVSQRRRQAAQQVAAGALQSQQIRGPDARDTAEGKHGR